MLKILPLLSLLMFSLLYSSAHAKDVSHLQSLDDSIVLNGTKGRRLKLSAYGDFILRVQLAQDEDQFLPDNHYEMVESHDWKQRPKVTETANAWLFSPPNNPALIARVNKQSLEVTFVQQGQTTLSEIAPTSLIKNVSKVQFEYQKDEKFTGLGHGFYGRESSIDLRG